MACNRTPCPCGRPADYAQCCGPLHAGTTTAATAEQLMRSRYSAYVRHDEPYLLATWHASTRPAKLDLAEDACKWLGLQIRQHTRQSDDHETVEFVARYKIAGRAHRLHELSRFVREEGRWFYVDGEFLS